MDYAPLWLSEKSYVLISSIIHMVKEYFRAVEITSDNVDMHCSQHASVEIRSES